MAVFDNPASSKSEIAMIILLIEFPLRPDPLRFLFYPQMRLGLSFANPIQGLVLLYD
jgi:hypothetical protein